MEYPEYLNPYIPPGFDLKKYDECKSLGLSGWYSNLFDRSLYRQLGDRECYDQYRIELLETRIETGCFPDNKKTILHSSPPENPHCPLTSSLDHYSAVTNVYWADTIQHGIDALNGGMGEELKKIANVLNIKDEFEQTAAFMEINDYEIGRPVDFPTISSRLQAYVNVDLSFTDEEILDSLSEWLKLKRRENNGTFKRKRTHKEIKLFSTAAQQSWYMNRVLAYLDLEDWLNQQRLKVPDRSFGELLFPEKNDTRDKKTLISETVRPLAHKLVSPEITERMLMSLKKTPPE